MFKLLRIMMNAAYHPLNTVYAILLLYVDATTALMLLTQLISVPPETSDLIL